MTTATDGHLPLPSIEWSPTHQLKDGHPPEGSVQKTGNLTLGDDCNGGSPTIPRRATQQPKDGHPP